jgi:hypothetical protein
MVDFSRMTRMWLMSFFRYARSWAGTVPNGTQYGSL